MRFAVTLVSVLLAASASLAAPAASLESRQIGNLACNVARFKIVTDLVKTGNTLKKVDTTDPTVADAVTTAQGGLKSAGDGIKAIAAALVTGQAAPADARDQVGAGLQTAADSLTALQSDDTNVQDTLTQLQAAADAGSDVLTNCK
ncbi:hypothetical protein V5O48_001804 [Marasmius crinis-equi]|uniref:Uncharacterized protein n=1 Tax=Marasmius crinis-equi TaxID=585013 RepID=A0ABR3FXE4_9AGAR